MDKRRIKKVFIVFSIIVLALIALFPQLFSGDKELLIKTENHIYFPYTMLETEYYELKNREPIEWAIRPPIPYGAANIQYQEPRLAPPMSQGSIPGRPHLLGTDNMGRDVLSGLIYGFRTAVIVGIGATLLSMMFGVVLGLFSAFYSERKIFIHPVLILSYLLVLAIILWSIYWSFETQLYWEYFIFSMVCLLGIIPIGYYLQSILSFRMVLPLDNIIQSIADFFSSVPALMLLLAFTPLFVNSGVYLLIFVIALIRWPTINRYTRAEVLDVQQKPWIRQLSKWNISDGKIMFSYILKAIWSPLIVIATFSVSSAIVLEATLSYLGLGYGIDSVSWGAMINMGREYLSSWWLIVFPSLAITISLLILDYIGRAQNKSQYQQEY